MTKRIALLAFVLTMAVTGAAQKTTKASAGGSVDKAYLQKILDGWAGLDAAALKQYYAQGPHVFFDVAPLKYNSWDEYEAGASKLLGDYKAAKFTVNDDLQIQRAGDSCWITATAASDMTRKTGKREMATFRWTAIFEKQGGKWLIVHEHVSEAQQ